jgi:hypothetical protein
MADGILLTGFSFLLDSICLLCYVMFVCFVRFVWSVSSSVFGRVPMSTFFLAAHGTEEVMDNESALVLHPPLPLTVNNS